MSASTTKPSKSTSEREDKLRDLLVKTLDDNKAEDITTIDLRGKVAYADYMIVASGLNGRHLQSLAEDCQKIVKENNYPAPRAEGLTDANWVILDAYDVIVHLFRPAVRQFYNIEDLWQMDPPARDKSD